MNGMKRRDFLRTISAGAAGLGASNLLGAARPNAKRPNIVFIFTDDHAPHAIGAYGGLLKDVAPTSTIDKLASEGMLFVNSFCANSICGPSRATIQTGKHSHLNGFLQNGNTFDAGQQTFPKLLRKAGYQTAIVGKWHLKADPQGYDYWEVLPGQGDYYNPAFFTPSGRKQYTGYVTDIVTDLTLDWLKKKRDPNKPFMLMTQQKAPHRNWMPPLRHLNLFDDMQMPEPPTLFDKYEDNASPAPNSQLGIDEDMHPVFDLFLDPPPGFDPKKERGDKSAFRNRERMTPEQRAQWDAGYGPKNRAFQKANLTGKALVRWKYQRYIKNYLRCIKAVDENVARLLKYLDEAALAENTIVIYCSDQGFYLGDHGWYDKRWMYEESLKMPLIVKWPGVTKPGSRNEDLVQNIDYAETFLDIAGAPIPGDMQGRSLVPLLRGKRPADWRKSIYYHYHEHLGHGVARHYGIRTERYKLIRFYVSDEWEFYDLQKDPDELTNLYGRAECASIVADLKKQLETMRIDAKDDTDITPKLKEWQEYVKRRAAGK